MQWCSVTGFDWLEDAGTVSVSVDVRRSKVHGAPPGAMHLTPTVVSVDELALAGQFLQNGCLIAIHGVEGGMTLVRQRPTYGWILSVSLPSY